MNSKEKIYQNKLSIYDLLVLKNKKNKEMRKDQLIKKISENLSDIDLIPNLKWEKKRKMKEFQNIETNQKGTDFGKINVIMEGKSLAENIQQDIIYDNTKSNFLLERFQHNAQDQEQIQDQLNERSINSLAVLSDIGTSQKYGFFKRPGKLVPISTLKPRVVNILPSQSLSLQVESQLQLSLNNTVENVNDKDNNPAKLTDLLECTDPSVLEQKQRKRFKIRSVEEILTSFKSDDYIQSQQESDIRIDELIKKVLERTDEDEDIILNTEEEKVNEKDNTIEVDRKGDFEIEAEKVLEKLELEQSLRSLDTKTLSETFEDETHCCISLSKTISDLDPKQETEIVQMKDFLYDLNLNLDVSKELIAVYGKNVYTKDSVEIIPISPIIKQENTIDQEIMHHSIHHICSLKEKNKSTDVSLRKQWAAEYIPDKYPFYKSENITDSVLNPEERIAKAAENIIYEKEKIEAWENVAYKLLEENSKMEIIGTYLAPSALKIEDIWKPIPPKLFLRPSKAKEIVCPSYNNEYEDFSIDEVTAGNTFDKGSLIDLLQSSENSFCEDIDLEALETKEKLISRRSGSFENILLNFVNIIPTNDNNTNKRTRCSSVPNKHWLEEDSLIIHLEYNQIMEEINIQKCKIKSILKDSHKKGQIEKVEKDIEDDSLILEVKPEEVISQDVLPDNNNEEKNETNIDKNDFLTPARKALIAGRNYVYYPPRKSRNIKRKTSKNISRISAIERFLDQPTNILIKTESFSNIINNLNYGKKKNRKSSASIVIKKPRSNSLSNISRFKDWSHKHGYSGEDSAREWITVVWDKWFDEIYPPFPDNAGMMSSIKTIDTRQTSQEISVNIQDTVTEDTMLSVIDMSDLPEKIEAVLEEVDEEFKDSVIETLHEEIRNLTNEMMKTNKPNAFLLSRRGTIYKKLGFLRAAFHDLNEAISLEPELLTAYWERHLLFLICNKIQLAVEDLNFILKRDKNNISAYKSRATIYASLGDISLAISNLSQAIRLVSNDADAYLKRAELYEKNGDQRLALEDYNEIIKLQPKNSLAMMKHGIYYINIEQWQLAIKDFSDILRQEPLNAEARLYRGMALSKLRQWQDALLDYSAVIHLDPNNYKAYFRRGCLLQKSEPNMAIRDFSISLLLNSTDENLLSYLYRAILYAQTKQFSEAIVDFEMVIYFSKDMCCAHVDLGLIYFENEDYEKATKYFTFALAADPTYVRAYACRAEGYFKMNMYDEAIKDINRAIHIYPERSNYYMLRGDFYLAKGKMNLAEMCVRQAAAISHNLGQSLVQQALVHSFLHNYDQAIEVLYQATRNKPTMSLLNLLGMTQMKAKRWKDAITSFSICLEQMKPKSQFKPWPPSAANLYFMVAQCYLEVNDYKQSQEAFKATVKINPKHAEAYYQQGWCRLRLGQVKKGILDLNKALAINPKLYQAYLARATLFGYKKQYTKAILNCNEVLKIESKCLRAYLYRGVLKYNIKAYSLAVRDLTEAVTLDPGCILAYFNRALCYNAEKRNRNKAVQDYSIVLMLKDELKLHQKSYLNRGIVYFELGDVNNALFDFNQAYSMDSKNINVLMAVGICHHRLRNLNDAILTFSKCLDYNPKFYLARICRGNVFMDFNTIKSRELALRDYESVISADKNNLEAFINLGFCVQAQGKFKTAWEIFSKAIENHPTSTKALDGRAIVCLQMRDLLGALKDLNSAISINPQCSMLYINRAVVHQLMSDGTRSMKDYNKAILLGGHTSAVAHYNLGCIYLHNHQLQQAYDCFMATINLDSSDEAAWMNLAIVHICNDKMDDALQCINKAISLAPYVAYFYYNRANLFFQLEEYEKAEQDFTKCLKISPDDAQVYKARADCRSKLGDTSSAIQDYKMSVYISSSLRQVNY